MRKKIAAGAAGLVLLAGGSAMVVRTATESSSCQAPLTIFPTEQTASVEVLEQYISENIAPTFKYPEQLLWASDDFSPVILPNVVSARIMVLEGQYDSDPRYYQVKLVRDCQGGEWKVVKFEKVK